MSDPVQVSVITWACPQCGSQVNALAEPAPCTCGSAFALLAAGTVLETSTILMATANQDVYRVEATAAGFDGKFRYDVPALTVANLDQARTAGLVEIQKLIAAALLNP